MSPSIPPIDAGVVRAVLSPAGVGLVAALWLGYRVLVALYNISPWHPLYKFPGPRLAAATYLFEAYYDWWLAGRYGRRIARMHDRYGPIVRINPDELHCSDPSFTDEIYAGPGRIRDRWQHHLNTGAAGPVAVATFSTVPHELHRARRQPLSRFFSRQQMLKLEAEVLDLAQMTVDKMLRSAAEGGGEPFNVKEAFNCFTADVISQYAFGETMGFVQQEGWEPNFATWVKSALRTAYMLRHNPPARWLAQYVPLLANHLGEDVRKIFHQMNVVIPGYIRDSIANPDNGRVFADLAKNKALSLPGESEQTTWYRLQGEGYVFLLAGTETTAAVLTVITHHLVSNPAIRDGLRRELAGVSTDGADGTGPRWTDLERRPYLWAVVHEALRMMPGVSHRSARIARTEDLVYESRRHKSSWVIPRGTPIGMTSMINHWNKDIFPEPDRFLPERWLLEKDGVVKPNSELQKYLLSFSRGSRACLGENLALCELYIMTALIALRVAHRARLVDTTLEDISYDHDLVVVQTKKGSITTKISIS